MHLPRAVQHEADPHQNGDGLEKRKELGEARYGRLLRQQRRGIEVHDVWVESVVDLAVAEVSAIRRSRVLQFRSTEVRDRGRGSAVLPATGITNT
jgi:hypothetical protein